jgi:uncharacterized protein (DUF2062 family)
MKIRNAIRKVKILFWKLAKTRDSTEEIAWGAAIGTFISVFPTFGFGTLLVLLLSRFFRFNLVIALAASFISNPFTSPFFMLLNYKTGSLIIGNHIAFDIKNWKSHLSETGINILVGSLIVSGIMALLAYYISKFIVAKYRKRHGKVK